MKTYPLNHKRLVFCWAVAVLAGIGTTARSAQQGSEEKADPSLAQVHGTVIDEVGKPVAGAEVSVVRGGTEQIPVKVMTDKNGAFRLVLKGPSSRYHTFVAAAEGGARQAIFSFEDTALERIMRIRLVLKPARSLSVRVTDTANKPIAGAAVGVIAVYYIMLATGETDASGKIAFRLPADAKLRQVVALKANAGFDYFENYRSSPGWATLPPPSEVTLKLDGAQTIRVKATDSADKPLAGIDFVPLTIQRKGRIDYVNLSGPGDLQSALARTDAQGVATFSWIPRDLPGRITFLAHTRKLYLPKYPNYDPAKPHAPLTAVLKKTVALEGKTVLAGGKPAAGILIQAEGRGPANYYRGLARSKADGSFRFDLYPDQWYIIAVTDADWAARSFSPILTKENEPRAHFTFHLDKGTLLRGKLTVGKDKKPAPNQTITLMEQGMLNPADPSGGAGASLVRWAKTDKDGKYSIRLGPAIYDIMSPGDQRHGLAVGGENALEKNFHVDRLTRGPLAGQILALTKDGKPVAGAVINGESIGAPGHAGFETLADDKGRFQTERWRDPMILYARTPDGGLAAILQISEDAEEISMILLPAGRATGRLLDKAGKPLPGVRITCALRLEEGAKGVPAFMQTDANGRFTATGLVVGARCSLSALTNEHSCDLTKFPITEASFLDLGDFTFP